MNSRLPNPDCVVKVGDGRGFITTYLVRVPKLRRLKGLQLRKFREHRLVITAAHCLPKLPSPFPAAHCSERTFRGLLGSLDNNKKDIWTECLFADPVSDVAVLGAPDGQDFGDEADAYDALTENIPGLRIGRARSGRGWVLSLAGRWIRTNVELHLTIGGALISIDPTEPGMSGSPILNDAGRAIGIVSIGTETVSASGEHTNERAGPQPILIDDLPGRLTQKA